MRCLLLIVALMLTFTLPAYNVAAQAVSEEPVEQSAELLAEQSAVSETAIAPEPAAAVEPAVEPDLAITPEAAAAPEPGAALKPTAPGGTLQAPRALVGLTGTPHLWISDEHGQLHWGGDTRALLGMPIDWGHRSEVTVGELLALPRADPFLTMGLLKMGNPIYLVKWETNEATPMLFHIQCIRDVELFGINEKNYGAFVLDQAPWEQRYGIATATLPHTELASACTPSGQGGSSGSGGSSASGGGGGGGGGGSSGGGSSGGGGGTNGSGAPSVTAPAAGAGSSPVVSAPPSDAIVVPTVPAGPSPDRSGPVGTFLGRSTDAAGKESLLYSLRDSGSGLASITVRCQMNATADVPSFTAGTGEPVVVRVTQTSPGTNAIVVLAARDRTGNLGELEVTITTAGTSSVGC